MRPRIISPFQARRRFLAGLLAVIILALGFLASSGSIHRSFHPNDHADQADCALCVLSKGQLLTPASGDGPVAAGSSPGWSPMAGGESPPLSFSPFARQTRGPPARVASL